MMRAFARMHCLLSVMDHGQFVIGTKRDQFDVDFRQAGSIWFEPFQQGLGSRQATGVKIKPVPEMWEGQPLEGLVISGLDSMDVRHKLWHEGIKRNTKVSLYIDGRMGGETILIYSARPIDPDDIEFYESELNTSDDTPDIPCTARAIIYNTGAVGSLIAHQVKLWSKGEEFPREVLFNFPSFTLLPRETRA